jgi:hypothetical protein
LQHRCRDCHRESGLAFRAANPLYTTGRLHNRPSPEARFKAKIKHKYGLAVVDFERMLAEQGGRCAICAETMAKPCIDHCHSSGRVRGLLCSPCNIGIGHLRDNPARLIAAARYLEARS